MLAQSLDGTLRIYDLLTTSLLRTFKDRSAPRLPARMLATGQLGSLGDEQRWSVSHVRATRDAVVAAVGGKIVSWRVDDRLGAIQGGKRRGGAHGILGPGGGSSLQGRMSARTERFRCEFVRSTIFEVGLIANTDNVSLIAKPTLSCDKKFVTLSTRCQLNRQIGLRDWVKTNVLRMNLACHPLWTT